MITPIKSLNITNLLAAVIFLLGLQPFFTWRFSDIQMLIMVIVPLAFIMITHTANTRSIITTIVFGLIAWFAAISLGRNIIGRFPFILVATIFLCTDYLNDVYVYFKKIYVVLIAISAAVWILVLLGFSFPSESIMPLNQLKDHMYTHYFPLLVMPDYDVEESIFDIVRFCGLFDEPGVVGTISLLMLAADNYNLRKPANIIIFITGIFSLSLFFYLGSFICIVFTLFSYNTNYTKKVFIAIALIFLLFISYNWEVTYNAIWERLEYDEFTGFSGNNRASDDLKEYVNQIRWTDAYLFGVQNREIIDKYSGSASIQNAILQYGLIGCILYALFFCIYIFRQKFNIRDALCCIIILFMTLWQRPVLYNMPYLFLYLIMIKNYGLVTTIHVEHKESDT